MYQEDLVADEFCQEIHACPNKVRSLEHQLHETQKKHDYENPKEVAPNADLMARKQRTGRVVGGRDAADSAVIDDDDDDALEL